MTKADLVKEVARSNELTRRDAEIVVQTVLDSIVEALNSGEKVELLGFGSFRHRQRNARQSRNPKTGEAAVHVPAKRAVYFKLTGGAQPKSQRHHSCPLHSMAWGRWLIWFSRCVNGGSTLFQKVTEL